MIGMRIVKTSLAITISVYIVTWLNLDSPFFAAVGALIAMQGNLVESLAMAKYRILGSIFGGGMGVAGVYLAHGNPLAIGLGAGLIIFIANKIKWQQTIVLSTVVFTSIMLRDSGDSAILFSISRVINTLVGIVVAVVVNYSIFRPLSRERVLQSAQSMVQKGKDVLGMLISQEKASFQAVTEDILLIEREFPGVEAELKLPLFRNKPSQDFAAIKVKVDNFYHHLALLASMDASGRLSIENAQRANAIFGFSMPGVTELTDIEIVYNYHLLRSLLNLQELFAILSLTPEGEQVQ